MKDREPDYTSHVSLRERSTADDDTKRLIMKSLRKRDTEVAALQAKGLPDNHKDYIIDRPPAPDKDYRWCSGCNEWVRARGFGTDSSSEDGLDHYCKECRREQERRWTLTRAFKRKFPNYK